VADFSKQIKKQDLLKIPVFLFNFDSSPAQK